MRYSIPTWLRPLCLARYRPLSAAEINWRELPFCCGVRVARPILMVRLRPSLGWMCGGFTDLRAPGAAHLFAAHALDVFYGEFGVPLHMAKAQGQLEIGRAHV